MHFLEVYILNEILSKSMHQCFCLFIYIFYNARLFLQIKLLHDSFFLQFSAFQRNYFSDINKKLYDLRKRMLPKTKYFNLR